MVDKANILATSRLWREITQEIASEYPEVETEFLFVDNAAMRMIQCPKSFDVVVTENMFGDILTDEGSVITGSWACCHRHRLACILLYSNLYMGPILRQQGKI